MAKSDFRKIRGIGDKDLNAVLLHHADVLRGAANALNMLLRERRLLIVWRVVVTVGLMWALLWAHTPDYVWTWTAR